MFIKSSIQEKNVKRAKNELIAFSQEHKHKVTTFYSQFKIKLLWPGQIS